MRRWNGPVIWLMAALASTSAVARGVSDKDLEGIQKMAVVVSLGDTLHAAFVGFTVFQNKSFNVPVPEWGMNKLATDTVVEAMKTRGGWLLSPWCWRTGGWIRSMENMSVDRSRAPHSRSFWITPKRRAWMPC